MRVDVVHNSRREVYLHVERSDTTVLLDEKTTVTSVLSVALALFSDR